MRRWCTVPWAYFRAICEVLQHPVSLKSRDVLVEKKLTRSFLPFLNVEGFGYGDTVHAKEPQFGNVVIDVQRLILALPHSFKLFDCSVCLSVWF